MNVDEIILRIRDRCSIPSDKELAKRLGLSQPNFANRKKRGTLLDLLIDFAIHENVNLHWLITGKDSSAPASDKPLDEGEVEFVCPSEIADLLRRARKVLTSGNQVAFDALSRNIQYFSHAIETERRLNAMDERVAALEDVIRSLKGSPRSPEAESSTEEAI